MTPVRKKLTFANRDGIELAASLQLPAGTPRAYALFAHCFTCGKDLSVATRISRGLARQGIATLRFDFTGLGGSDGDFANTDFSSNVDDLLAAADFLAENYRAPALLIGHSLGGTAVLAAAGRIDGCRAVATIAAPAGPEHITRLLCDQLDPLEDSDKAIVEIAGRRFTIRRELIEDAAGHKLGEAIAGLDRALLIFHSPTDEIVDIGEAGRIYAQAHHPKSFISLDGADHLLTDKRDALYIADTLAAWANRYLFADEPGEHLEAVAPAEVLVTERNRRFTRCIYTDDHAFVADEPAASGGDNLGPDPYELLLAALGSCTSMTVRLYANRKQWPLDDIEVTLSHTRDYARDCEDCDGKIDVLERRIRLDGDRLSAEQRERLLEIANRCPVHRTLSGPIEIPTSGTTREK